MGKCREMERVRQQWGGVQEACDRDKEERGKTEVGRDGQDKAAMRRGGKACIKNGEEERIK